MSIEIKNPIQFWATVAGTVITLFIDWRLTVAFLAGAGINSAGARLIKKEEQ